MTRPPFSLSDGPLDIRPVERPFRACTAEGGGREGTGTRDSARFHQLDIISDVC